MRRLIVILFAGLTAGLSAGLSTPRTRASDPDSGCTAGCISCTGGPCQACVPGCKAMWDEKKTTKPHYSLKYEYACVRGRDPWHAPAPECRCHPPCGEVIVKKRLYKTDGPEKVERVPKYDVRMVPAEPCGCADCGRDRHGPGWDPVGWLAWMLPW